MARVASAKRQAQAVFQLAMKNNEVEKWRADLIAVSATLKAPELMLILENPKVHLSRKQKLIAECLPGLSQLVLNFIYLLVAKQRLGILNQIVEEYEHMADAHQGLEHAKVVTAVAISAEDQNKLSGRLEAITGKKIVLTSEVDPAIIGGFVARVGDTLIDGSTRAKLDALKKRLVSTV